MPEMKRLYDLINELRTNIDLLASELRELEAASPAAAPEPPPRRAGGYDLFKVIPPTTSDDSYAIVEGSSPKASPKDPQR